MPTDLHAASLVLCSWVGTYLLHSTVLLMGTWLLFRAWRGARPSTRELAWKAALVGGLVTTPVQQLLDPPAAFPSWQVVLPGRTAAAPEAEAAGKRPLVREESATLAAPADEQASEPPRRSSTGQSWGAAVWIVALDDSVPVPHGASAGEPGSDRLPEESPAATGGLPPGEGRAAGRAEPQPTIFRQPSWSSRALVCLAAAGMALMAWGWLRCGWQTWRLNHRLARCTELCDGPVRSMLDELCDAKAHRRVRLLLSADELEPAAFGVRRWTILLPARALHALAPEDLRSLLAHELAHLVRGDSLWLWLSRLICCSCAFQPLNHLARREWQRAAELLCDAWAVARTGRPLALARCLTEVAGWRLSRRACPASLAVLGRTRLSERIERLIECDGETACATDDWSRTRDFVMLVAALAGLVTLVPGIDLRAATPPGGASSMVSVERTSPADQAGGVARRSAAEPLEPIEAPEGEDPLANLANWILRLDQEIRGLERDLAELEPLLARFNADSPVSRWSQSLKARAQSLRAQRAVLVRLGVFQFVQGAAPRPAPQKNL